MGVCTLYNVLHVSSVVCTTNKHTDRKCLQLTEGSDLVFYIIARKSTGISCLSFQVDLQNFTYKLQNSRAVDVMML